MKATWEPNQSSALEVFISTDELDEDSLHVLVPSDVNFIPAVRLAGQVTEFSLGGLMHKTPRTLLLFAQSMNSVYQVLRCLPSLQR